MDSATQSAAASPRASAGGVSSAPRARREAEERVAVHAEMRRRRGRGEPEVTRARPRGAPRRHRGARRWRRLPMVVWVWRNPGMIRPSRSVGAPCPPAGARPAVSRAPARRGPVAGSRTSPNALTATSAPTVAAPTRRLAVPRPPFMARAKPKALPTDAPVARADRAFRDGAALGLGRGARAHGAIGTDVRRADREVVEDGADDQRHEPARGGEADPAGLEVRHDAEARLEPEGAPAGEDGAVDSRRRCDRGRGNRGPGGPEAPPRISTAATAPAGQRTAVHPVSPTRSAAWPTRRPATSVRPPT